MPVVPGTLRSLAELELLVSLSPCPACGNRDTRALQPHGGLAGRPRRTIGVTATCARCATERLLEVEAEGDLTAVRVERFHLGGAAPATTITPAQFMAELDRVAPTVVSEVEQLEPAAWRKSGAQLDRVITCLVELLKFAPAGVDRIEPGADAAAQADLAARPERYQRAWIEAELTRYLELDRRRQADAPRVWALEETARPAPRGELTSAALQRHRDWLHGERKGPGRLDLADLDATGAKVGTHELTWARLERVTLVRADLSFSTLEHAELLECDLSSANLGRCGFGHAHIVRGKFDRAALGLARFHDAEVTGGSFDAALLDRTSWNGARVTRVAFRQAEFGNAAFDGAHFVDCDLRGASLALSTPQPMGTTAGAVFERCDLRDTSWDGRDLTGARFIDCRWHGAHGRPGRVDGIEIIRPDLSARGDGRSIGGMADVLGLLGGILARA
jgi:uncharacterized protein YjbI with pentapeptide repeats